MRKVPCPQCGKLCEYKTDNPSRPFCSERCQLIDLGQWADEKYKIPLQEQSDRSKFSQSEEENNEEQED
jgi:uncharacterized protein